MIINTQIAGGGSPSISDYFYINISSNLCYVPAGETVYIRYNNDNKDRVPMVQMNDGGTLVPTTSHGTTALGARTYSFIMPSGDVNLTWQW